MSAQSTGGRVLLVSGLQVYPTLSGGHLRTFALANALARRGSEVFVYSFVGRKKDYLARKPSGTQLWPSGVKEHVNRSSLGFLAGYGSYGLGLPPIWLSALLYCAGKLHPLPLLPRLLREKLAWCDTVIADFPFLYPVFGANGKRSRLCVLNLHNVEHHFYDTGGRLRDRLLRTAVRHIEHAAVRSADVVVTCAEGDKQYFESNAEIRRSLIVRNGIDPERFYFAPETRTRTRAELAIPDNVKLFLFTASKWGPNQEAFDFLLGFAKTHERRLVEHGVHLLVVGNAVANPVRLPALTATGKVDVVEPYFAAADAAINPLMTGGGTNVKMGEFIAARLPVLVSAFGARGYRIEHSRTGFIFERENLLEAILSVRRFLDSEPAVLQEMVTRAFVENAPFIDMNQCIVPLAEVLHDHRRRGDAFGGLSVSPTSRNRIASRDTGA
jgi:glycosyltransferase involved in cell wall biosynthesis